jgi:hypothetical protein
MGPCTNPPSFRSPSTFFTLKSHPPWLTPFSSTVPFARSLSLPLSLSAGDENRTAEHDTDVLRDFESTRAVCALGNPRVASAQCDIGSRQERRSGPAHQHIGWGWRTVLPTHGEVKVTYSTCLEGCRACKFVRVGDSITSSWTVLLMHVLGSIETPSKRASKHHHVPLSFSVSPTRIWKTVLPTVADTLHYLYTYS